MYKFKTKYKSSFGTTDELQYIRQGESAPQSTTDTTPQFKQSNYNFSIVAAVSSGTDGYCTFGKMNKYSRHRLFKKDNVIYDLTF